MTFHRRFMGAWLGIALCMAPAAGQDSRLGPEDMESYLAALKPPGDGAEAIPANFHDLWSRPELFQGRRVRVEGRVARMFHQGATGRFPPLVEIWIFTPSRDPICVVCPEAGEGAVPKLGETVSFEGTFLRRVRYEAGDVPRLAPLLVGDRAPTIPGQVRADGDPSSWRMSPGEWALGCLVALAAVVILLRQHLRSPLRIERPPTDPPPVFEDQAGPESEEVDRHAR